MFVQLPAPVSADPCRTESVAVETPMRNHILGHMLLTWQTCPDARQAILRTNAIPRSHLYFNGLQRLEYELEHQDLKALFRLFQRPENRSIAIPLGASQAETERAMAELKAVYRLLKATVSGDK